MTDLEALAECWKEVHEEVKKNWGENKKSKVEELENIKQKLERNKEFTVIDAIEQLEKENAELKDGTILKELTEKCKKQAEQIEKMKCCRNCANYLHCKAFYCLQTKACDKWELAE